MNKLRFLGTLFFFLLLSCSRESLAISKEDAGLSAAQQAGGGSGQGSGQTAVASATEPEPATEEDEEARYEKFWDEIQFDWPEFDEVLELVKSEYIEKDVDYKRAYVSAASFAMSLLEPAYDLVPEAYWALHKEDPDLRFDTSDRDENIRQRRLESRKQQKEMLEAWAKVDFGRPEFERVVAFVEKKAAGDKKAERPVTKSRILLAAVQGFLYSLDPHSSLVSQKAWDDSTEKTHDASFDGIGAVLTQRWEPTDTVKNRLRNKSSKIRESDKFVLIELGKEDKLVQKTFVESPMQGQPAARAGLWAGDEIILVDGKAIEGMPLTKVVSMIRGPRGTSVKLTVARPGESETREVTIPRSRIKVTNVEGKLLEQHPGIGYVKLTGFIETSYKELLEEILRLDKEAPGGLRGLVFDLRLNSGGLLQQAVQISDLFITEGKIVTVKNRKSGLFSLFGSDEVYKARPKGTIELPINVLVNDGSASASEIVASAIQDNGRGLVIGERTFGKASVQTLLTPRLGKGYYVKLTVARYYGPSDRTIQVFGVQPDVEVPAEFNGKVSVGFREEDLSNHLPPIETEFDSPNKAVMPVLNSCVQKTGIAANMARSDPTPQVKFDYQLFVAADYLECQIRRQEGRLETPLNNAVDKQ